MGGLGATSSSLLRQLTNLPAQLPKGRLTPMTTPIPTSSWQTNRKYQWASREESALTLLLHRGMYLLLSDRIAPLVATGLDEAIGLADALMPPASWSFVVGMWIAPGWKIQKEGDGWAVFSQEGGRMSKQTFSRADLARKWCEVRNDRVGINLRGPKPSNPATPTEEVPDGTDEE